MGKWENLKGKKFGLLVVLNENPVIKKGQTYWKCKCDCGNILFASAGNLKNSHTKSCGCLRHNTKHKQHNKKSHKKGYTFKKKGYENRTKRLAKILDNMKQRCYNTKYPKYKDYGGKGVKICDEWLNDSRSFYNWATKNGYDDTLTIDRINVKGNYEPSNCRWITRKQQAFNRRNSIIITINGESKPLLEWCKISGISEGALRYRFHSGYSGLDLIQKTRRK